jgi:hypothetical protein
MKFTILFLSAVIFPSLTHAITLSYDREYDKSDASLSNVACSDGPNGLMTHGFTTFGSLPKFPYIGGAAAVAGWNSPNCGTCWNLTYTNPKGIKTSINVLAIDHTDEGFNIAFSAMNKLTSGKAMELGRVDVGSQKIDPSMCGL